MGKGSAEAPREAFLGANSHQALGDEDRIDHHVDAGGGGARRAPGCRMLPGVECRRQNRGESGCRRREGDKQRGVSGGAGVHLSARGSVRLGALAVWI